MTIGVFLVDLLSVVTMGWSAVKNHVAELEIPMHSVKVGAGRMYED